LEQSSSSPHATGTRGEVVVVAVVEDNGMMPSREYLAKQLAPYPLPTKDGGVLRTIGDARVYMVALPRPAGYAAIMPAHPGRSWGG
jgi:hypothetical protein